ncbi:helix-turn-helix protein [Rhodococcus wratislaviensis]|uniref:Helix-turn-helix n=1 Tax=Rhodococcus wratislaviensis TaxID=44752 RepID=A0AB38FK10_RHOWR|nr:helix-turn-helix transcriptional regulator [Rhodococcus wratislaviensis]REE74390.1 helix-turn-helix protein [Rhodococcus wratislaviensis]SPZ42073.1 Helix-turn-helix [Rhodococcus wratislaviensis]
MATRRVETGPTGDTVRTNIAIVRKELRLTLRDLADRMTEGGRPMAHNTLSEIERGARRVDVDDLVAISIALDVSPNTLLRPRGQDSKVAAEVTGARVPSTVEAVHYFLEGVRTLNGHNNLEFALRSLPDFMQIRRDKRRRDSWSEPGHTWIHRAIETDGRDVKWSVSESDESVLAREDEDD